jgi:hypothetical protein
MSIVNIREAYLTLIIRFPAVDVRTPPEWQEDGILHFAQNNTRKAVFFGTNGSFLDRRDAEKRCKSPSRVADIEMKSPTVRVES